MPQSLRRRTTTTLPISLQKRLGQYALAASAAGVGALALAVPAEGKIIYTHIHKTIATNEHYLLDLNHDGVPDFIVSNVLTLPFGDLFVCPNHPIGSCFAQSQTQPNEIWGNLKHSYWASALARSVKVAPNAKRFMPHHYFMAGFSCQPSGCTHPSDSGPWKGNVRGKYLGLKFLIKGKVHYGWARLNVSYLPNQHGNDLTALLTGYAYETIPNKHIVTGQTHGADIAAKHASLGQLAAGTSTRVRRD